VGDLAIAVAHPLTVYKDTAGTVQDTRPNVTYDLNVISVSAEGQWLEAAPSPLWAKVADDSLNV
jgi:hypothetical protein